MPSWSSCPVCLERQSHLYVTFDQLSFAECPSCGTVYKTHEKEDVRTGDFYEADYFHGRKSGRDKRFEHRVKKSMRQIRAAQIFAPAAQSLLDVGCSFGYVIEAGKRLGLDSAGTDISQYAVDVCRERGYRAQVGELGAMPFDDGSFNIVILKHVLEHTPDPRGALEDLRRITTDNAVLVIVVPDLDYWKGRWRKKSYRYFRPDDLGRQHYVYYTAGSLCRLLEESGFVIRARSKATRRNDGAGGTMQLGMLYLWQSVARVTRMRRELFVVAQKR